MAVFVEKSFVRTTLTEVGKRAGAVKSATESVGVSGVLNAAMSRSAGVWIDATYSSRISCQYLTERSSSEAKRRSIRFETVITSASAPRLASGYGS